MSDETPLRPTSDKDREGWKVYWTRAHAWLGRQSRTARLALGVSALVVFALGCSLGVVVGGSSGRSGGTPLAQSSVTHSKTPTATASPTATAQPKSWVTVEHITGNQNQQTPTYHIPAGSRIVWSVTPATQYGGFFSIHVYYAADNSLAGVVASTTTPPAQSGVYNTHTDVDVYFNISSSGDPYDIAIQVYR